MAIATAPTTTLSLNGDGNLSGYIPITGYKYAGLKLTASNSTAVGNVQFCICNSSTDSGADPMDSPVVPVAAGTAVDDYAELVDLAGDYLVARWDQTTGEAVTLTISFTLKE